MGHLIGVFGGTFDPPHIGHCILAEQAYHQLGLEAVIWIPAAQPPHKPDWPLSAIEDRMHMVESITQQNPRFELSRIDVDRPGPHYAKDTLVGLRETYPDASFAYLMGADSLRDLYLWKDPELLVNLTAAIGVMPRPLVEYDLPAIQQQIPGLGKKLSFILAPLIDVSGQNIRRRVREGLPFRYMVTPEVYDRILQRPLYR